MGILFNFKAYQIKTSIAENYESGSASVVISQEPVADPISDAMNNVRLSFNGFGGNGGTAMTEMRSTAFFKFQVPEPSRIKVHGHFTFGGIATTAATAGWFLDLPGVASVYVWGRMRLRVWSEDGVVVLSRSTQSETLGWSQANGSFGAQTGSSIISAELLEKFHTISPPEVVLPSDRVYVRMQYVVQAWGIDGGEFVVDFAGPNMGLNVPMVVLNY